MNKQCVKMVVVILFGMLGYLGILLTEVRAEPESAAVQKKIVIHLKNGETVEGKLVKYEDGIWQIKTIPQNEVIRIREKDTDKIEFVNVTPDTQDGTKKEIPAEPAVLKVKDKELEAKIADLIKKLGDDAWDVREDATTTLQKIGRDALPALKEAIKNSQDPEVKFRTKMIVESIEGTGNKKREAFPVENGKQDEIMNQIKIMIDGKEIRVGGGGGIDIPLIIKDQQFFEVPPVELVKSFTKAMNLFAEGKYEKAIEMYQKSIETIDAKCPNQKQLKLDCEYNIACAYSLLKKNEDAIKFLERAIKDGFNDFQHMQKDTDLDNIRNDAGYKKLIEPEKAKLPEKEKVPEKETEKK